MDWPAALIGNIKPSGGERGNVLILFFPVTKKRLPALRNQFSGWRRKIF
jgi:hypothetical protein